MLTDIDECADPDIAINCTKCENTQGSYKCIDVEKIENPCENNKCENALCVPMVPQEYDCICLDGFVPVDNLTCRHRDCREDFCFENEVCVQANISFSCLFSNPCSQNQIILRDNITCGCPINAILTDSGHCEYISVCEINNGKCEQICESSLNGAVCSCFQGFQKHNLTHCQDIDECLEINNCEQKCLNNVGSFKCKCWPGFFMNSNDQCEDINECNDSAQCEYNCTNLIGSFECGCPEHFVLAHNNLTCEKLMQPCEVPNFIESGIIHCNQESSQCNITCNEGFISKGSLSNICFNGKWNNEFAQCLRKFNFFV